MTSFILNQQLVHAQESPGMVLLDFVRDVAGLPGTKDACREGECGACTVLVGMLRDDGMLEYKACASCLLPIGDVEGGHVVTVEGISGGELTLVQQLMVEHSASQCGYCTPGIVLSLTGFCLASPTLSHADAVDALDGNICRCTGYVAIRNAAAALVERLAQVDTDPGVRIAGLVKAGVLPDYFLTVSSRLAKLKRGKATGDPQAVPVAGGTDLFVQRPEELEGTSLMFLSHRSDFKYIRLDGGLLRIGASVTLEELRHSELVATHFPSLPDDLLLHSSTILRNKATLTGNIVNASPIGDATIILLALNARLGIVARGGGRREVPLDKFFHGYKKIDLHCGELIDEVAVPLLPEGAYYSFEKVSNRVTLDIAAVNSAIYLTRGQDGSIDLLRISAGGVGPVPFLVDGLEAFQGRRIDAQTATEIASAAEQAASPIDDIRGTAAYKRLLLRQLVLAHFSKAGCVGVAR